MELDFWQQRWKENQIGFHLDQINPYLTEYWPSLNLQSGTVVLVPMCGKSLDMTWLNHQEHSVLGVECSEKAVLAFFSEQNIQQNVQSVKSFSLHSKENYNLLLGDFFKLDKTLLSEVTAVYDRASLVAMPEKMRQDYVNLLVNMLPEKISILLVTLEYEQSKMSGPPFSVTDKETHDLYSKHFSIETLHQLDIIEDQPRFKQRGLDSMIERVYKITR